MRSFYSLIDVSTNTATGDSIAIGIVFFDGKVFHSYFSDQKRKLAQRLIDNPMVDLKSLVAQIYKKCDCFNDELTSNKLMYHSEKWTNSSYFEYLNSYSNGLLQFSAPHHFISSNHDDEFEKLVGLFFKETINEVAVIKKPTRTEKLVRENLIERV